MVKTYDLEYRKNGLFTFFIPNTKDGESAWRELSDQTNGTGKVFTFHFDSVLRQLRRAGYSVRKAPEVKESIKDILKELSA